MNKAYISALAVKHLAGYLSDAGYEVVSVDGSAMDPPSPVYNEILTHPDIHMCQTGLWENARIFRGNTAELECHYPGNIIYNAVCTGKYFIHNLRYTAPDLMEHVRLRFPGIISVDVRQGYTRCSCLPVDERSFITSDRGIASALAGYDADVLLTEPGHISLPGFDYGFIGGCGGGIIVSGRKTLVFNGDLSRHPDYKKIATFAEDRDIDIVFFEDCPLEDTGSILVSCDDITV